MNNTLINGLMFNLSWLVIVANHSDALAMLVVAVHLCLHFLLFAGGWREALLVLGVSLVGYVIDQWVFLSGILVQTSGLTSPPLWLSCLWPVFATTLLHLFAFLINRPLLAIPLGALGGSLSYVAGSRLANVQFVAWPEGPLVLALLWALLMPFLVVTAGYVQRRAQPG